MNQPASRMLEVANPDPEALVAWYEKRKVEVAEDGTFVPPVIKATPASFEILLSNMRANLVVPEADMLEPEVLDDRIFVMVCGGPSLMYHLDDVRERTLQPEKYRVVCSNMTAGYLLQNGIVPHVHFIMDPQSRKRHDVRPGKTNPLIEYWISATCDPAVVQVLVAQGIRPKLFLAQFDREGSDVKTAQEVLTTDRKLMCVQGGTMAGMRALNLADVLGHRQMEYFGFDGSVIATEEGARCYAYDKYRMETVLTIHCDKCEAKYDSTSVMQAQVNELLDWRRKIPYIDIRMHGNGLIQHYMGHIQEIEEKARSKRATYRYTEEYKSMQLGMHERYNESYGVTGPRFAHSVFSLASQVARSQGECNILDYGSSWGSLERSIRDHYLLPECIKFINYDPFVLGKDQAPVGKFHIVVCNDVLEHVEPECTYAVLDHLQELTGRIIFLSIGITPALKTLPDGRNAHINLRDAEWWLGRVKQRFIVSEAKLSIDSLVIVGQDIELVRRVLKEKQK